MDELSAERRRKSPTPAEIEACCAEIRAHWNSRTFRIRAGLPATGFPVEVCKTSFAALTRRPHPPTSLDVEVD